MSNLLVYDGDCPFCNAYVHMLRLKDTLDLQLINARTAPDLREEIYARGMNLDDGMVLVLDGAYYHGSDCIHRLALMSTPVSWFNALNHWIFRSPTRAKILYPVLRLGRNITLLLLGRKKMSR